MRARSGVWVAVLVVLVGCAVALVVLLRPAGHHGVRHCVYTEAGVAGLQEFERAVGQPGIQCAEMFNESAATWQQWADPFSTATTGANRDWSAWVRADPRRRLIVSQSLIPSEVEHQDWLALGARGAYAGYAVALARDLVGAGLGRAIIRLAPEMNGTWETYSLPTDPTGLAQWREFWRRTVVAMRSVRGAHFTFDWNVNALVRPVRLSSFYPGNAYVNVVGIDAYDPVSIRGGWDRLANGPDGVRAVARFAAQHGKPLSVPEWGVAPAARSLSEQYLNGLGAILRHTRTAYECYFFAHQYASALTADSALKRLYVKDFLGG